MEDNEKTLTEGTKYDEGKLPIYLLPSKPLEIITEVLQFGAEKYTPHNWRKGMKWSRLISAIMRHLLAWKEGEDVDPETGISHLGHIGCDVLFLLEYEARGLGEDDRYKV